MQCKLYFYYKNEDWIDIRKHLENIQEPYQIVTNSYLLNEHLRKIGKNSSTLRDIFPEEGDVTYDVYRSSKKVQKQYEESFCEVKFLGFEVFSGFENQLLDQIILLEKTRKILEQKKTTIFIFENFSFTYFSIMKLATELGYENDLGIEYLLENKVKHVSSDQNLTFLESKNKLSYLKKYYFSQFAIRKNFNKLKSGLPRLKTRNKEIPLHRWIPMFVADIAKRVHCTITNPVISLLVQLFIFRLFSLLNIRPIKIILKRIDSKILKTDAKYESQCAFFLTTNQEDVYLKSIYPVLDKFNSENMKIQVFTIDLVTDLVLSRKGISSVNLFGEINLLMDIIRRTNEGIQLRKDVENIAIKNNLSLIFTTRMSPHLLSEIYRTSVIMFIVEHIIQKMNLDSIVIATDGVMYGNSVVSVSKKYQIPSYFIASLIINSNPLHSNWYHADKICIYGLQGIETLTGLGYDKNRLILTGNPKYDKFRKLDSKKSHKILEEYNIDSKKKLVMVGMARWHEGDEIWMSKLIKFCNKNNFEIVIKVHPMYKEMLNEESEEKISKITQNCQNMRFFITYDIDLHTLISAADLVITEYSNVGAEAILMDKPLITVNFVKESFEKDQRYHEYGAAIYTEEYQELEKFILEIFIENKHKRELEIGRKIAADKYNYYNDGKATERIFELLTNKKKRSR